jgi:hypothetical protein
MRMSADFRDFRDRKVSEIPDNRINPVSRSLEKLIDPPMRGGNTFEREFLVDQEDTDINDDLTIDI